jgi:hypothetical protein
MGQLDISNRRNDAGRFNNRNNNNFNKSSNNNYDFNKDIITKGLIIDVYIIVIKDFIVV